MRNLKKVLSLALAMVMLLGMMVVGAGATSFKDDADIKNQEAVDVVSGIGILTGVGDNTFNPTGTLTRAEAAVVIAKLDLGAAFGNLETTNASTFKDVAVGSGYGWAKPYIDYCYARGLIAGDGNGYFFPAKEVSGVEFALMVSRVLGYEDKAEQVGGADWEVEAAALARKADLTINVTLGSKAMTRDEMAQVTYNALKADMVEYKNGTINIDVGGTPVTIGGNPATAKENKGAHYDKSAKADGILQLCEEKFPQLTVNTGNDSFGRPSNVWTYKRDDIAEVPTAAHAEYTTKTKGTTIATALKPENNATVEYYEDGKQDTSIKTVANLKDKTSIGDNGVLTQAWYDEVKNTVKVTLINTYVGKIGTVNATAGTVTVVERNDGKTVNNTFKTEGFTAGDLVTYTIAYDDNNKYNVKSVEALEVSDTGVLNKWVGTSVQDDNNDRGKSDSNFTIGDNNYKYSKNNKIVDADGNPTGKGIADFTVKRSELNVYLDKYNYAIYISGVEGEKQYAAVIGVGSTNAYGSQTNGVTLLFPDGTTKAVEAKVLDISVGSDATTTLSNNTLADTSPVAKDSSGKQLVADRVGDIVSYTVDDNGVYELTVLGYDKAGDNTGKYTGKYAGLTTDQAATAGTTTNGFGYTSGTPNTPHSTFVNGRSELKLGTDPTNGKTFYTTSKTIFFVATKTNTGYSYAAYTGYANMPSFADIGITGYAYMTNRVYSKQIDVIYISANQLAGVNFVDTYFVKKADADVITDSTGLSYYELPAIVAGEKTTVKVATSKIPDNTTEGLFAIVNVVKNRDDIITNYTNKALSSGTGTVMDRYDVVGIGTSYSTAAYYAYTKDTNVYCVDKDYKDIWVSSVGEIQTDDNDLVRYTLSTVLNKTLVDMVIIQQDPAADYTLPATEGVQYSVAGGAYGTAGEATTAKEGQTVRIKIADASAKVSVTPACTMNSEGSGVWSFTMPAKNITKVTIDTVVEQDMATIVDAKSYTIYVETAGDGSDQMAGLNNAKLALEASGRPCKAPVRTADYDGNTHNELGTIETNTGLTFRVVDMTELANASLNVEMPDQTAGADLVPGTKPFTGTVKPVKDNVANIGGKPEAADTIWTGVDVLGGRKATTIVAKFKLDGGAQLSTVFTTGLVVVSDQPNLKLTSYNGFNADGKKVNEISTASLGTDTYLEIKCLYVEGAEPAVYKLYNAANYAGIDDNNLVATITVDGSGIKFA